MGFSQKVNTKTLLEKYFNIDIDYKFLLLCRQKQNNIRSGHNKETIIFL
jgi:hypothetical protein